ncbi:hypothetical protein [Brevundimonas sp. SGAir0440]|uniref:hypothetical protein n=1 Tax=Brevundimonas sp. SGAir0440 TaxID=2579977 RepID=UPI0010CD65A8|nr:hypothetical protein [Brevundimonas sp. SGAir0440]QCQ97781.1 hypothetical protein E7T10_03395 [Brevundimonas sp. SGAir0440]
MSIARITQNQADEVKRLRTAGRTDRQIETIIGLTYGLLSEPYRVAEDERPIMNRDHLRGRGWIE